jgi:YD repeat-containing protein
MRWRDRVGLHETAVFDHVTISERRFLGPRAGGRSLQNSTNPAVPTQNPEERKNYTKTNKLSTRVYGTSGWATATFLYDAADRATSIDYRSSSGTALASFLYSYDAAGRVSVATNNATPQTFTYDNANQLLGDGSSTFTYDNNGNRDPGVYTTGTGNQLKDDGTYTYTYDNQGNLTQRVLKSSGDTWIYSYDNHNELTGALEQTSGATEEQNLTFKYDAFGNRIEKDIYVPNVGTTTYRYELDGWKTHIDAFDHPAADFGRRHVDVRLRQSQQPDLRRREDQHGRHGRIRDLYVWSFSGTAHQDRDRKCRDDAAVGL